MRRYAFRYVPLVALLFALGAGPLSNQGATVQTSFAGEIDPTNPAYAGGMVACNSSCTAYAERNRAAFQAALTSAAAQHFQLYVPPGQYPIGCKAGQSYGIDWSGANNVHVRGYGAVLRFTGDQGSSDCAMWWLRNVSGARVEGLTFSGRDATNPTTSTLLVKVGDGGATSVDNVVLHDVQWVEGSTGAGDCLRADGGTSSTTVTRLTVNLNRFEGCARAAIDVRPGVSRVAITWNFFRSNANRDVWLEDTGDGAIGQFAITGNMMERATSATATAVTLSGHGGTNTLDQSSFALNRIVPVVGQTSGGGVLECSGLQHAQIGPANTISLNRSSSTPNISCSGKVNDVLITDNYLERLSTASDAAVVKVVAAGGVSPDAVTVRANRVLQYSGASPGIDVSGTTHFTVVDNLVTYHAATADSGSTGFAGVYCSGASSGACSGTVARNRVKRDDQDIKASLDLATKTTHDNTVVEARLPGTPGNSITVAFVGDAGTNAGSIVEGTSSVTIHFRANGSTVAQVETLFAASTLIQTKTAGTAANVLQSGDAFSATALAGAAQAGRVLTGVELLKGAGTTIGSLSLRDNFTSGARTQFYVDADGSAQWPDGYPVVSGNQATSVTNEFEGGVTTYRTESTADAEVVTSGATSTTKHVTFITTANTVAYTQADGLIDGAQHCFKVKSTSGTPNGTWTPTHFADGTTHTVTWTSAGGAWCVVWDATNTTYRLQSIASPATLN